MGVMRANIRTTRARGRVNPMKAARRRRQTTVAKRRAAVYRPLRRTGGFMGLERKFLDTYWNDVSVGQSTDASGLELQPTGGCTSCISCPAQGDGASQRDGRKFVIDSFYLSGIVNTGPLQDSADAADLTGYFFALVLDTQANGVTINSEDVYTNPGNHAHHNLPQPLRNLENSTRFKVLASGYFGPTGAYAVPDGANTGSIANTVAPAVTLSWSGKIPVTCGIGATSADVASVQDNAVHVIAAHGNWSSTTFKGKCRMRFTG